MSTDKSFRPMGCAAAIFVASPLVSTPAVGQASPFMTGATALQANLLEWLTPIAVILVMALGAMAMANRMSWGWCLGAILGMEGRERDRRLWFIVDELDALGAIDGLKDALARLRKFGGRCVLGFQSVAQVSGLYGQYDAQTVIENCGNTLIFRCSSSERGGTAQFASRLIGDTEVVRTNVSRGRDQQGLFFGPAGRRSVNVSEQTVTEPAVMASEIEQLPDLTGYLKCASSQAWVRVAFAR